jgi:hypothetical protein
MNFLGQPDHDVVRVVVLVVLRQESARGDDEEEAEHVEQRGELVEQGGADEDERGPREDREDDAEEQRLLLARPGDLEAGQQQEEHEQVVHRERLLGDVPREVLHAHVGAAEEPHGKAEDDRDPHVEGRPDRRLLERRDVLLADVEEVVEQQQRDDQTD